ncbi:PEPxxWA-CTERM sorting domain-containing protein [Sphingobium fluviale]|uniref:PEP-CTERM sorting domain-containing protein n=1 Tax=Sphingobium fluviale TaxID=2506423 RepID=A0A4Q1KLX8_9SPHN|nr:PEPxxWA-CTERM sorting domain-containing protein [Sphingobium fluviale]RXR30953.1 PEP-CTERM sorting domain-containing protein [Sphingobium fluviale]
MKLAKWASAAIAGAMMAAPPGNAGAVVLLDQLSQVQNAPSNITGFYAAPVGYADPVIFGSSPFTGSHFTSAQSLTANATGTLDHVDFSVFFNSAAFGVGSGNLTLSLIDGDYASGAQKVVGQAAYDLAALPNVEFDANILNFTFQTSSFKYRVKQGQKISIVFSTESANTGLIYFNGGYAEYDFSTGSPVLLNSYLPNYAGGKLTVYSDGNDVTSAMGVDNDLTFASYVDTSSGAPEPTTWSLLILGFGGIGAAMRRRVKSAAALAA